MKEIKLIKTFISCPSDIGEEVKSLSLIIEQLNKTIGAHEDYMIEALNWKLDTYSSIGEDAQSVINHQIDDEYDVLIAIIWKKLGSPTKRENSGTVEEIKNAIKNNKKFLIFFNNNSPNLNEVDIEELQRIREFKKELSSQGVLYKEFSTLTEFENLFRANMSNLIHKELLYKNNSTIKSGNPNNQYEKIEKLLSHSKSASNVRVDNIFDLVVESVEYLEKIGISLETFTKVTEELTENLNKRTIEINHLNHLKDERLKGKKLIKAVNLVSKNINDYCKKIKVEIPEYSENFSELSIRFSEINPISNIIEKHKPDEIKVYKESVISFRNSLEFAIESGASMLESVMEWPPFNQNFNKAKRNIELTLNELLGEMLAGLKIFDEYI